MKISVRLVELKNNALFKIVTFIRIVWFCVWKCRQADSHVTNRNGDELRILLIY